MPVEDTPTAAEDAFAASLAGKLQSLETEGGDSQPRDKETGQYVAREQELEPEEKPEPEAEVEEEEPEAEEEEPEAEVEAETPAELSLTVDDPAIKAVLEKYGNDPVKALKALADQSSLIGKHATTIEELQNTVAALQEQVNAREQDPGPDPRAPQIVDALVERERYQDAAVFALQQGDQALYEQAMDAWFDNEPRQASRFETLLETKKAEIRMREEQARAVNAPRQVQDAFNAAYGEVLDAHPDYDVYATEIGKILDDNPELMVTLRAGTHESKVKLLENLYDMARGRTGPAVAKTKADLERETEEAAAAAREKGRVAKGSKRQTPPTAKDQFKDGFRGVADELGVI